ncbi:MAG: ABC transporter substrate-binding protein [Rhizobiaceae bacterium]|nr:ABC transporter substrate-binding protein [Rhizobiaceae bacterium]
MHTRLRSYLLATAIAGTASVAAYAQSVQPTTPPDPPQFDAQTEPTFVGIDDILEFRALESYNEPAWVTKNFVETGKLPPVSERLPEEPMVYKTGNMPDGIGEYGDTLRHVIGGRPQGWNWSAGQIQGWGGITIGLMECLTRTGPLYQVKAEELEPLPNLAKDWQWSEDGKTLTMNLIRGAKWSDGAPFTSDDIMFYWEDNVLDPNVTPLGGVTQETFGEGTTLKAIDEYTIEWTFTTPFPKDYLYAMAYRSFCPGPAHILRDAHPKYSDNTYEQYTNAFPTDMLNWPTMGAWVPVEYRPDDIIVLRRNPYFWKVDEEGNQLPYLHEVHYKLSTWADRDVQAVAGSADHSALEQPENFVESLKRSAEPDAPARLAFGPRTIGYSLYPNLSANGWGEPDARAQAIRELNRDENFRKAITTAIDRQALGNSLVKGPFTAIYPGGLYSGTAFYDKESTVYYPFSVETAKEYLSMAGLEDTDGNGFVNHPSDVLGGADVKMTVLFNNERITDKSLAEGLVAQLEAIGLSVTTVPVGNAQFTAEQESGKFDWFIFRNWNELISVVQQTTALAPVGPRTARNHRVGTDGTLDLLPWEEEMVEIVNAFIAEPDLAARKELMKRYQKLYTENLYAIGLTQYPGAEIINKRFANYPEGVPIFMFNWDVDSVFRERVFVPADKQQDYELFPTTLPGEFGKGNGPIKG